MEKDLKKHSKGKEQMQKSKLSVFIFAFSGGAGGKKSQDTVKSLH